jgi:hypothetical protein
MTVLKPFVNPPSCENPLGIRKSATHDAHDGDDDELQRFSKWGATLCCEVERRRDGREHGEYKRDKARRCSRLVWPLGDRKNMLQLQRLAHHAHRILAQPVQASLIAQPWRRTRPGSLPRQHFLHYFSEEVLTGEQGIRTSEKTPSLTLTE